MILALLWLLGCHIPLHFGLMSELHDTPFHRVGYSSLYWTLDNNGITVQHFLCFNIAHYSSLFHYFLSCIMVPTLVKNSCILAWLLIWQIILYITWWTHAFQKVMVPHAPVIIRKVKYPLHCCKLRSTHYTAIQIWNHSNSIIKVATRNTDNFCYKRKPSCATAKLTRFAISKDEWNTKEDNGNFMILRTVVCHKAPLRLKQRQTVKKLSLYPKPLLSYTSLKASVS